MALRSTRNNETSAIVAREVLQKSGSTKCAIGYKLLPLVVVGNEEEEGEEEENDNDDDDDAARDARSLQNKNREQTNTSQTNIITTRRRPGGLVGSEIRDCNM